jgi:hypothetical protein
LLSNAFKDVDAYDFRNHLNQYTEVDVTDFFNDWIFKAGFPAFYIDSFMVEPIGGGYFTVATYVRQKLKGTTDYFTHVPIEITFVKSDWTTVTETFDVSNPVSIQEITLPFVPVFAYCNGGDKIGQAVTGENNILTSPITRDLTYPMIRFTVNSLSDSALLRIEHFWVSPDPFKGGDMDWEYQISKERFWKISGIVPSTFNANMRIWFNGTSTAAGNLDNELVGYSGFHEDSMVVLHRYTSADDWRVIQGATITTLSSKTDGYGYFTVDTLRLGEYTFGWRKSATTIAEPAVKPIITVYPNPARDIVTVDVKNVDQSTAIILYDATGKTLRVIHSKQSINQIDISELPSGNYFFGIAQAANILSFTPFVKL